MKRDNAIKALGFLNEWIMDRCPGGPWKAIEPLGVIGDFINTDPQAHSASVITDDQITAGAAVLDMKGKPVGRNVAIDVFEAMCSASKPAAPQTFGQIEASTNRIRGIHCQMTQELRTIDAALATKEQRS